MNIEELQSPKGGYSYWEEEITSANKRLNPWRKQGKKIVQKFKGGSRKDTDYSEMSRPELGGFRLNLFHSNVVTLQSMLYGNLPKVDVSRRYSDPNDDVGRVAGLILERMLNNDVQDNGEEYNSTLRGCLQDRLLPGVGCARIVYRAAESDDGYVDEEAPAVYYHWDDVAWGYGRSFSELPWISFRNYLTKDAVAARFGAEKAALLSYQDQLKSDDDVSDLDGESRGPWKKAEIYEVWDKTERRVHWVSVEDNQLLDTQDDPLQLSGFYPCPPFLIANCTTDNYLPTPDYHIAQDLYNELDALQTRISILTEAVKVVGVYDSAQTGIERMLTEGCDNDLIPVEGWARLSEQGGLEGCIDWLPIQDIVLALEKLEARRDKTIGLLQQVTGMSDIMRGELGGQYEGVQQSKLKAKFGSVRVQSLQDEFAKFASDLLEIKAEVICRHFKPESIIKYANLDHTFDQEVLPDALRLLKNPTAAKLKVKIRPESIAMVDYAQLQQERTEFTTALATFMQSAGPLMELDPNAKPYLLHLLKWGLAGFKGSSEIEGVLDKAIQASMEEAANPKPDKEAAQADRAMQLEQLKHKNAMAQIQAKAQADMRTMQADLQGDLAKIRADLLADLEQVKAKMIADIRTELATSEINADQQMKGTQGEIIKDVTATELELEKMMAQAEIDKQKPSGGSDA